MSSGKKDSLLLFKQKEIFDELVNKWKFEIDKFCEQINLIIPLIIIKAKVLQNILSVLKVHYI